jgi:hypothetical protein
MNATTMPNLLKGIRLNYKRATMAKDEWLDATIELAAYLKQARDEYQSDNEFGSWLDDNDVPLSYQDRAGLLRIAEADPDVARNTIREAGTMSWRLAGKLFPAVVERNLIRFDSAVNPPLESEPEPKQDPIVSIPPSIAVEASMKPAPPPKVTALPPEPLDTKQYAALRAMPRSQDIMPFFPARNPRATLNSLMGTPNGPKVWKLMLAAYDAGLYGDKPSDLSTVNLNLRYILPQIPGKSAMAFVNKYDLKRPEDRTAIMKEIIPMAVKYAAEIRANPDNLEQYLRRYRAELQRAALEPQIEAELHRKKLEMPGSQYDIAMYGKRLWPVLDSERNQLGNYSYTSLCHAIWWFRDIEAKLSTTRVADSPANRAYCIKELCKWPILYYETTVPDRKHAVNEMWRIVQFLCELLKNTNGIGECKPPPLPVKGP